MADTMQVELVSPEKSLASMEAEQIGLPGGDGDFTAMPGHVATATTLRPGLVSIQTGSETIEYLVAGGFAEVTGESVSILAEFATRRDEADREMFEPLYEALKAKAEASEGGRKAEAERDLGELEAVMKMI